MNGNENGGGFVVEIAAAIAALFSAIAAFLLWRIEHRNLRELTRPELMLRDPTRFWNDPAHGGHALWFGLVDNNGRGPAFDVQVEVTTSDGLRRHAQVPVVPNGKHAGFRIQIILRWHKDARKTVRTVMSFKDSIGVRYRTEYVYAVKRDNRPGPPGSGWTEDGIRLQSRATQVDTWWTHGCARARVEFMSFCRRVRGPSRARCQ